MSKKVYDNEWVKKFETKLFVVRVKMLQSRSVEHIKFMGSYVTGIKEIDKAMQEEIYTRYMTIKDMVDHFKGGNQVYVPNYVNKKKVDQVAEIYTIVEQYLIYWRERLRYGVNTGDAPITDLVEADLFANSLYGYAKYSTTPEDARNTLYHEFANIQRVNHHNFFTQPTASSLVSSSPTGYVNQYSNTQDRTIPDRESMGEFFKQVTRY